MWVTCCQYIGLVSSGWLLQPSCLVPKPYSRKTDQTFLSLLHIIGDSVGRLPYLCSPLSVVGWRRRCPLVWRVLLGSAYFFQRLLAHVSRRFKVCAKQLDSPPGSWAIGPGPYQKNKMICSCRRDQLSKAVFVFFIPPWRAQWGLNITSARWASNFCATSSVRLVLVHPVSPSWRRTCMQRMYMKIKVVPLHNFYCLNSQVTQWSRCHIITAPFRLFCPASINLLCFMTARSSLGFGCHRGALRCMHTALEHSAAPCLHHCSLFK